MNWLLHFCQIKASYKISIENGSLGCGGSRPSRASRLKSGGSRGGSTGSTAPGGNGGGSFAWYTSGGIFGSRGGRGGGSFGWNISEVATSATSEGGGPFGAAL